MQINALRKELQELMKIPQATRPPVLRRSLSDEWLYATDLPAACSRDNVELFLDLIRKAGWEYTEEHGWLLTRKPAGEPPEGWYDGPFGPEAGCCRSLLERHGQAVNGDAETVQRLLIKAGEEGEKKYEAACAVLHSNWAERLRRGETLPDVNLAYFTARKE
ncbi:MAG: hypothetical protein IKZ98_05155 [Clostridia bacterium]|nr:hypothetical protein [Clostridia bacterium]